MPRLIDTTLREGEQTPYIHLSLELKKRIISGLIKAGVDEIELGVSVSGEIEIVKICRYVSTHFPQQSFSLWCRCREDDIRFAATCQPSVLSLSIPTSTLHLEKKLGRDQIWAQTQVTKYIKLALSLGIKRVALGFEDASRAEPLFLQELAASAREAGAFRVRIADTVGIADPAMIAELVKLLKGNNLEVAVHCHNDFGMATANTITAFGAGAKWGDATILGLGERAGNSRMEEIMAYFAIKKGGKRYKVPEILKVCRMVASETGREIPSYQPLLGSSIFTCESGLHQHGILADPATYEPYSPALVGKKRSLLVGAGCGSHGLSAALKKLGLPVCSENELNILRQLVRKRATHLGRPLHKRELFLLASRTASIPSPKNAA